MAEIKEGILGPLVGKIASVVGVKWRGRNILRSKPTKSKKKATETQLKQWDKMSLVSSFCSRFKEFVNANCPPIAVGTKWLNGKEQMISRLMKQGVVEHENTQYINIEKVLLSIGVLAPAVIKKINRLKTGKLKVQWDNALINPLALDTDQLTIMAYHEDLDQFIPITAIAQRRDKYAHFNLPEQWTTGRVYLWSMWKAQDGSVHSTSCFHGVLDLNANSEELPIEKTTTQIDNENKATDNHTKASTTTTTPKPHSTVKNAKAKKEVNKTIKVKHTEVSQTKTNIDTSKHTPSVITEQQDKKEVSPNVPFGLIRKIKKVTPKNKNQISRTNSPQYTENTLNAQELPNSMMTKMREEQRE
ncbi:DUF6266 family protein [Myroides albus]|uniref:DUF6266 family protein n=1 Tax=Myroides albus TaxID=2562892 RepID=UPI0021593FCF|nr:DUF6266 family protein [Myroides albus]UVD80299.1 DUF6266 family protein [Myroides albus]